MTKQELIKEVATAAGATQVEVDNVVKTLFTTIKEHLTNAEVGESISFAGFGKFTLKLRNARTCRHPRTGETIDVPAKHIIAFKPAKELSSTIA